MGILMIFVTLGTNDKQFTRLLDVIDKAIQDGIIKDKVVVQSGFTKYHSDNMEIFESLDREKFAEFMNTADLIITHGGVGTIMTALKEKKKVLAAARLSKYHEHVNDHQTQILEAFDKDGYIIYMKDLNDLSKYLEQAKTFAPKSFESNQDNFVSFVSNWIDNN